MMSAPSIAFLGGVGGSWKLIFGDTCMSARCGEIGVGLRWVS
jgi:hypothetical protein